MLANKSPAPDRFSLWQNYPNPFNPTTTIEFGLPATSQVTITVYDVRGRRVAVLADDQFGPGSHSVRWDATDFASGVYFYRIKTGDIVMTRSMTLLK